MSAMSAQPIDVNDLITKVSNRLAGEIARGLLLEVRLQAAEARVSEAQQRADGLAQDLAALHAQQSTSVTETAPEDAPEGEMPA